MMTVKDLRIHRKGMSMSNYNINIAFICDNNFVMPTVVALTSLIKNKNDLSQYDIYIIGADISEENIEIFHKLEDSNINIIIIRASAKEFMGLHQTQEGSDCVASISALLKFKLPKLLPNCDKALYLDGDILIVKDLLELYNEELDDKLACVVIDSGIIYYKHKFTERVKHYFNSGVMLLNLKKMRENNICEILVNTKEELKDFSLMDQNVFNIVFDGKVKLLPIKYNFLVRNLTRAKEKYRIADINKKYDVNYNNLNEIKLDSHIIHFSSKEKPWKFFDIEMADIWYDYFLASPFSNFELSRKSLSDDFIQVSKNICKFYPKVSVIIPVYNTEKYINNCLNSIINQTLEEIEIICVDDGSSDNSLNILKYYAESDKRISIFSQRNKGQSSARNIGIKNAMGEYLYFLDSDDYIANDALELLYAEAKKSDLELLLFDGTSFYENKKLENDYNNYKNYYSRNNSYPGIHLGADLYVRQVRNSDYKISPCMQFIKNSYLKNNMIFFKEGIIHEDNLFSFVCLLQASRVKCINNVLFFRRVRESSTMTASMGFRNFKGYFLCVIFMLRFLDSKNFDEQVLEMAGKQISSLCGKVRDIYDGLTNSDKELIHTLDPKDRLYFRVFIKSRHQYLSINKKKENNFSTFKSKLYAAFNSYSSKIGRVITFVPKKILGIKHCYKENGLKYTFNRAREKLRRIFVRIS